MHYEQFIKEGIITVDNVRTTKAYQNAIDIVDQLKQRTDLLSKIDSQFEELNTIVKEFDKLLSTKGSTKEGQWWIELSYGLGFRKSYCARKKLKKSTSWEDTVFEQDYKYFDSPWLKDISDVIGNIQEAKVLIDISKQAIHAFAITTSQAKFVSHCENTTLEGKIKQLEDIIQENDVKLNLFKEDLETAKSLVSVSKPAVETYPTSPYTAEPVEEFVSVFSPKHKEDARTVWQWIKDLFKCS